MGGYEHAGYYLWCSAVELIMDKNKGRPLVEVLGLKDGMTFVFYGAPSDYFTHLRLHPIASKKINDIKPPYDFVQVFSGSQGDLNRRFPQAAGELNERGCLWVCWLIKTAKLKNSLDEETVVKIGTENDMVFGEKCTLDSTWYGVKFVFKKIK